MTEILKYEILLVILKTNIKILFEIKSITYLLIFMSSVSYSTSPSSKSSLI